MIRSGVLAQGEGIYLRKIDVSDVNREYLSWMLDPQVNQYLESRFEKWTIGKLKRYVLNINKDPNNIFLAIILKDDHRHIGNIKIGSINRLHKRAELGIVIGAKDFWGKGIATEAIKLAVNYSFRKIKLNRLSAGAYEHNLGSIKAFQKAGFMIEGVERKHFVSKGSYTDGIRMGIVKL
jgi:ribosomal-protein-alanine N-acetyltransferase